MASQSMSFCPSAGDSEQMHQSLLWPGGKINGGPVQHATEVPWERCRGRGRGRMSRSATSPVPVCPLLPGAAALAHRPLSREAGQEGEAAESRASSRPLAGRGAGTLAGLVRGFSQTPSSSAAAAALPCQMPWHFSMSFVPSLAYVSPLIYGRCGAA